MPSSEDTLMTKLLRFDSWTEQESNILKENYLSMSIEEIRKLIPTRSKVAIINKAHKLALRKLPTQTTCEGWKTRKLRIIERHFKEPFTKIYQNFREQRKTHEEIALTLRIDPKTLSRYLKNIDVSPVLIKTYIMKTLFNFTSEQSAYLAGLLDGDGTISIHKQLRPNTRLGYTYSKNVSIGNTNLKIIEYVAKLTGLHISPPKTKPKGKPSYCIGIYGHDSIIAFLQPLMPFLIGKKERANLMVQFCQSRIKTVLTMKRAGKDGYSKDECEIAENLRKLVRNEGHPNASKVMILD